MGPGKQYLHNKYQVNIFRVHDITDKTVEILKKGLTLVGEPEELRRNYCYEFKHLPGNLFKVLEDGRYLRGAYYVITDHRGDYVGSAGWNHYDDNTALVMTRMYVVPKFRRSYIMGHAVLPSILDEVADYNNVWMTVNHYNKGLYYWFVRVSQGRERGLCDWPDIYKRFKPIGERDVYNTKQLVMEYQK